VKSAPAWIGIFGIWLMIACGAAHGQTVSAREDAKLPPAPAFWVRDDSGVYAREPESLRRLSDILRGLEVRHGLKIYLVLEPVLLGQSASGLANELNSAWLPDGEGFVIVYESDTRSIGLGRSFVERPGARGGPGPWLGANDMLMIWTKAAGGIKDEGGAKQYIEALVTALASGFDEYFTRKQTPPPAGRALRTGLFMVGGGVVLALAVMGGFWLTRRSEAERARIRFFPLLDTQERLGAPFGGGSVSSRRFRGNVGGPR